MDIIKKLSKICESALNEGAGAGVEFHFDTNDREYKVNVSYECDGTEIEVKDLLISDYYYSQKAYDGGKFIFTEDDLKNALVEEYNNGYNVTTPIKKEDITKIIIVDVQNIPNLSCSWGWVRTAIPDEMIISESGNGYFADLRVEAIVNGLKNLYDITVDGKYIPSDEVKDCYAMLGEDDEEDFDESLNEKILADGSEYRTMKEVTEENGDILWAANRTIPLELSYLPIMNVFDYSQKNGFINDSFKYYNDYVVILKSQEPDNIGEYFKQIIEKVNDAKGCDFSLEHIKGKAYQLSLRHAQGQNYDKVLPIESFYEIAQTTVEEQYKKLLKLVKS